MNSSHDDVKKFGKVAVLYGGSSQEREVSLASGHAVNKGLRNNKIDSHLFDTAKRPLQELISEGFDRAFIVLHGRGGEDGAVQGALEHIKLPYTGTGVQGSAIAMDKLISKQIWKANGLPTAPYIAVNHNQLTTIDYRDLLASLNRSVMVKPVNEGSSIGMAKADNELTLKKAIKEAMLFDKQVLVEQYIEGKEYTVSIVNDRALPSIRMRTPHVFYDYEAKYKDSTTEYFCPSGLDEHTEQEIRTLALRAFNALNGKCWGRVDIMQNQAGNFYLLESNTVPGMTNTSLVPKAARQAGIDFDSLVYQILSSTLVR